MKDVLRIKQRVEAGEQVPAHDLALSAMLDAAVAVAIVSALYWVAVAFGADYGVAYPPLAGILFIVRSTGLFAGLMAMANRAPRKSAVESGADYDQSSADFTPMEATALISGLLVSKGAFIASLGYLVIAIFV